MSTEEIIQRTRLLDSEIKVGSEAPLPARVPPHTAGPGALTSSPASLGECGDRGFLLRPEKEKTKF